MLTIILEIYSKYSYIFIDVRVQTQGIFFRENTNQIKIGNFPLIVFGTLHPRMYRNCHQNQPLSANFTIPIMLKTAIINSFLVWRNVDVTFLFITNLQFTFILLQSSRTEHWKRAKTQTLKLILITLRATKPFVSYPR